MSERGIMAVAVALLMAACVGGAGRGGPPEVIDKAREFSEAGRDAFAAGRHDEAVRAYGAALDLHRSVENGPGIVRNLVNLAVVSDAAGRRDDAADALAAVDRYVATVEATTPADLANDPMREVLVEARWLRAKRALDDGDTNQARQWLESARSAGGRLKPSAAGRCDNLEARICEQSGDGAGVVRAARRAVATNRRAGNKTEEADSWRILGRGLLACGDGKGAGEAFGSALELDRELARTKAVGEDLSGMARAATMTGDAGRATVFLERAQAVDRARKAKKP